MSEQLTHNIPVESPNNISGMLAAYSAAFVAGSYNTYAGGGAMSGNEGSSGNLVSFRNKNVDIEYNLSTGTADFYRNGIKIISGFFSEVNIPKVITSKDYPNRSVVGSGNEYTVVLTGDGKPVMKQHFYLSGDDWFITWVSMDGDNLSSNLMAPIGTVGRGAVSIGNGKDIMALWVPFDNDKNAGYNASSINKSDTSYEVAAFYDNASRNGLVTGSVTHDAWKTGINYIGSSNKLDLLEVYGGVTVASDGHDGTMKRDVQPHGSITGNTISSPRIFVGYFDDWRNGMEAYADANAAAAPLLQWNGGVPFGWNSWGAVGSSLSTGNAIAASDFLKSLSDNGFNNNDTVYVNLDSFWDSSSIDLYRFVQETRKNGQKAGIYWAPFADWGKDPNRIVEGTNYRYKDIWLKDANGKPIDYGDGAYALDPTHPGTLKRMDYFLGLFKSNGFDAYIKLDFLTYGALEGKHYDPSATTGMLAYNMGMKYLDKAIYTIMGPQTFISEAISPLFPYQYANSRRISCDKYGYLYESRDLLNSVAYGWWMNGRLYSYNDPDHMVLYSIWWKSSVKVTENEAKTRVTSAAIAGTVFLSGDDFTDPAARDRVMKYLTNPNINKIARLGRSFRPIEANTGRDAPDTYVLDNGNDGFYIAVFNFNGGKTVTKTIDLQRAGLDPSKKYTAVEQWSNSSSQVSGKLSVSLNQAEAKIFLLK